MKQAIPRINIFLHLSTAFWSRPESFRLSRVRVLTGATITVLSATFSSSRGSSVLKPAFSSPLLSKASESMIIIAVLLHHLALALSAAGFIATSMSQRSPGVVTCSLPMWTWKPETPETVP